ncbi:MAG: FGGY-family carbohydrate kinase [Candidatus Hydrogenedentes bacterium]|nr:FGGY-family carbohydrate kinase [Candidatus Hydrogenedentota bacterium]
MKSEILLGVDLGTTVLKVAVFDSATGQVLAQAARRLPVTARDDGAREQDWSQIERALDQAVVEVKKRLRKTWSRVSGIGLASQAGSGIIVDRGSLRPLTPMILWNDARAASHMDALVRKKPVRFWQKHTLRNVPSAGLGRLLWIRERLPRLLSASNIYVGAGEFLLFRLTGVWRQDAGSALQNGCYNAVEARLDQTLLDLAGVTADMVAPLRQGHELHSLTRDAARRLGLGEGIPVAGPYFDQEAGYLSSLGSTSRPMQCSLGTAWVGNFALPERYQGGSPFQIVVPNPSGDGRLVVQPLLTGNVSWDWVLQHLIHKNIEKALERTKPLFEQLLLPPNGLVAIPWLTQTNPFCAESFGAGVFIGLSTGNSRDDLVRATAAGLAFEFARVFDGVKSAQVVDGLVLTGGASKGKCFQLLFSALMAPLPVFVQTEDLAPARGAIYAFSPKAAQAPVRCVRRPAKTGLERIAHQFSLYRRIFDQLYRNVPGAGAYEVGNAERRK